jgi:DNA-binding response OmpR family regulator
MFRQAVGRSDLRNQLQTTSPARFLHTLRPHIDGRVSVPDRGLGREFNLLDLFLQSPGTALSRVQIETIIRGGIWDN